MEEEYLKRLALMASTVMNRPVNLSPVLEYYGALRYIRLPLISPEVDFQIVLNVKSFNLNEVLLTFPKDNVLQLSAAHAERDIDGFPVVRNCVYNFELPVGIHKDVLTALWTDDEFLIIQPRVPTPSSYNWILEETRLVPQRIGWVLKNDLNISILKSLMSDVEDNLGETLDHMEVLTDDDSVSETALDAEIEVEEEPEGKPETMEDLEIKEKSKTEELSIKEKPEAKEDLEIGGKPKTKQESEAKERLKTGETTKESEAKEDPEIRGKRKTKQELAAKEKFDTKVGLPIKVAFEIKVKPTTKEGSKNGKEVKRAQ